VLFYSAASLRLPALACTFHRTPTPAPSSRCLLSALPPFYACAHAGLYPFPPCRTHARKQHRRASPPPRHARHQLRLQNHLRTRRYASRRPASHTYLHYLAQYRKQRRFAHSARRAAARASRSLPFSRGIAYACCKNIINRTANRHALLICLGVAKGRRSAHGEITFRGGNILAENEHLLASALVCTLPSTSSRTALHAPRRVCAWRKPPGASNNATQNMQRRQYRARAYTISQRTRLGRKKNCTRAAFAAPHPQNAAATCGTLFVTVQI